MLLTALEREAEYEVRRNIRGGSSSACLPPVETEGHEQTGMECSLPAVQVPDSRSVQDTPGPQIDSICSRLKPTGGQFIVSDS